jgi:hypothetical protein
MRNNKPDKSDYAAECDGGAMVANLDGSVTVLNEEDLRDMSRWSNQAAFYADKDFNSWDE